tara:strand:- start:1619 stop:1858 length:240 start_codon:yes stop_codon:yes gene_type:complete
LTDREFQKHLLECTAIGEILYDTIETFATKYEDRGIGETGGIMMVIWELISQQLLRNDVDGNKLRVVLMELQDEYEAHG